MVYGGISQIVRVLLQSSSHNATANKWIRAYYPVHVSDEIVGGRDQMSPTF